MVAQPAVNQRLADIVERYFSLIHDLRNGDEESVPRLMDLWDTDGTFEFAGASPVIGTFHGAVAIRTLYQNRLRANGRKVTVETTAATPEDLTLGVVETHVTHVRTNGDRVAAGWRTTIGTTEGQGFDVAGSHLFVFDGDKIKSLRVTVSPKADQSQLAELRAERLTVNDVGRLSVAAWAVV
jgi:ketosteroid isomerase-like protein